MRVNGFGEYPVNNISSGGQKNSVDAYNKALKGSAYYDYEEYASRNSEEYHHYSEYNDITDKKRDKKDDSSQSDNKKRKNSAAKRQRMIQQVVGLVAGSVVIVTSYQAVVKQQVAAEAESSIVQTENNAPDDQNQILPSDLEETTQQETTTVPEDETASDANEETTVAISPDENMSWEWNDGKTTAKLVISDKSGKTIREIEAKVSLTQKEPTCTKQGTKTYTAAAEYDAKRYTDIRTESISALGHSFGEGKEVVLDNGQTAMTFECMRCHERFTIQTSITEND